MAAKNERKPRPNASEKDEVAMMNKKAIMGAIEFEQDTIRKLGRLSPNSIPYSTKVFDWLIPV